MTVEVILWIGLYEMYCQYIDSDDMPAEQINPYIAAFAKAMSCSFCDVLDQLHTQWRSEHIH